MKNSLCIKFFLNSFKSFSVPFYKSFSDHDLLPLIRKGDQDAYGELYSRYYQPIFRSLRKYLRSDELSEDVTQNVFVKFWEQREEPTVIHEPSAWLFTMAKRQAFNFLQRAATEYTALGVILDNYPKVAQTENEVIARDYLAFIEITLDKLPETTREVFRLCRQQHKTYEEAADILGISRSTVKKHMIRSMSILKEAAENELGISLTILLAIVTTHL